MYKKCEEILKELENEKKIKVWWTFKFPEKEELKLRLKDLLETNVDEKYYLSDKMIKYIMSSGTKGYKKNPEINPEIAKTLLSTMTKMHRAGIDNYVTDKCIQIGKLDIKGYDCIRRIYSDKGISPTLTDMQGGNRQPKILELPCIAASRGRNPENPSDRTPGIETEQRLEINNKGTSNCITTVQKDNYVIEKKYKLLIKNATKLGFLEAECGDGINISSRMEKQRGNVQKGTIQTITTSGGNDRGVLLNDYRIRKLTPKECWRLMGFSDEDFEKAEKVPTSNTQLYKEAGNSICVPVLERIFRQLFK